MTTVASRIMKNTGWLYAKMGITMFISLYTTRLILNGLGASDFGIYNLVGGAIAMLSFLNAALAATTQRFMSYAEGEGNIEKKVSIFNVSIALHFAIAIIMGVMLFIMGHFFFHGILSIPHDRILAAQIVYCSLILSTMFTVMTVPYDAVMNSHENMRYYAIIGIVESLLKLSVAFICVYTIYDKLIVFGIFMTLIPFIILSIMRYYCHKKYSECHINLKKYYHKTIAFDIVGFAGWTFITTVTSMITQYGMGIVLNHFLGVIVNAAHGIAMQLSGMLVSITLNAQKAFNPILTKSEGAQNRNKLIYISLFGCRISFYIFGFFSLPIILLMPVFLSIWLKVVPEWTIIFCRLLLIRILLDQLVISLISAINAEGHIKGYSIMRSITYVLPIPFIYISLKQGFPPYWLYIIWAFFWSIAGGIGTIYYAKKIVGILYKDFIKTVLFPCLFLTAISLFPYFIGRINNCCLGDNYILTITQILLFCILGFYLILKKEERETIISVVHGYITKRH